MKAWTFTAAALAATLTLAACLEDGPGAVSAVPGPAPEPGDPATYAPAGWPLQIGDKLSSRRRRELGQQFPGLGGVYGINVVNGRTYGARWGYGDGLLMDEDPPPVERWYDWYPPSSRFRPKRLRVHFIYEGHFPMTVNDRYWQYEKDRLPEHLHGRIEYHEEVKRYDLPDRRGYRYPERQRIWEEERAQMRADGLLPTPAQRSPERNR